MEANAVLATVIANKTKRSERDDESIPPWYHTAMTTYKDAGVDIENADATKQAMKKSIDSGDSRVLNSLGAFASLTVGSFPECKEPILVLKTEEPGSKQLMAFQQGKHRSICYDTINHLINDIVVMGAKPLYVQDAIICGKLEKDVVTALVDGFASACSEQDCVLVGGETSEQPGVLQDGSYILTASIVGIVDKAKIIDGSTIQDGDVILAVASNGLHTNGYTLVRKLLSEHTDLASTTIGDTTFMEWIMKPHTCYWHSLSKIFDHKGLTGMAHITGGGIEGNLGRIMREGLQMNIDRAKVDVLEIFKTIQEVGNVPEEDMYRTYNMGVGVTLVVRPDAAEEILKIIQDTGHNCYPIGTIQSV